VSQSFTLPKLLRRDGQIERVARFLAGLSMSKAWRVEVSEARSQRSVQQCRYLNGVAYKLIGDATGYERDEVSEFLCGQFWGWKEKKVPKKPSCPQGVESVPIRTTTTDESGKRAVLGKLEFADYVAFVQRFAAQKGICIPDPDQDYAREESND
jgi:hypothetical protein